jgi:hypothetical protein
LKILSALFGAVVVGLIMVAAAIMLWLLCWAFVYIVGYFLNVAGIDAGFYLREKSLKYIKAPFLALKRKKIEKN